MEYTLDLKTEKSDIYNALVESEDCQTVIGITSRDLGPGVFMTCVREIVKEEDIEIAILNSYDITGHFLQTNRVPINNITSVIPFKGVFMNPYVRQFDGAKTEKRGDKQEPDYIF